MSQRRLILLCLLVTPLVMFCINLLYSGSLDDQQNGFQIITLIISAPIIFLNAWEWQQPESLDSLIPPNFKSSAANPIRIDLSGKVILVASAGLVVIWIGLIVFGLIGKSGTPASNMAAGPTLDISLIQTAAVETALADAGQNPTSEVTPHATENSASTPNPAVTQNPLNPPELLPTTTLEPDTIILQPIEFPTSLDGPTEIPALITLAGSGSKDVDFQKWDGPAIVEFVYHGTGSFVVTKNSTPDNLKEQFVNKSGSYNGAWPLDFLTAEYTSQFGITASGPWKIQIIRPASARTEIIPTTISGSGDDVFILSGATPDLFTLDASLVTGIISIHAFRSGAWDLVAQETAPYTGNLTIAAGVTVLQISATGPWSIVVTGK